MKPSKPSQGEVKDPICGMTVDPATALRADREGKTYFFCSDRCKQKFLTAPAGGKVPGDPGKGLV